jgi:hypothetical protein
LTNLQLIIWLDRDVGRFGSRADRIQRIIDESGLQTEQPCDDDCDLAYWYVYGEASAIFALNKALSNTGCETDIN